MATLRTYSATLVDLELLASWRLNETSGTIAVDGGGSLDGSYQNGVTLGQVGKIGDGAARFDGMDQVVSIETLSGTLTVAAFGDSLIGGAGFQAPADEFSPNLEVALDRRGLTSTVIDRGVGGETTAKGLARVDDVIGDDPDVVIVEFGTNDANQKVPPATVEDRLTSIVEQLQAAGLDDILITGTFGYFPGFRGGTGYANEAARSAFEGIFADVASATGVTLLDAGGSAFLGGARQGDTIVGGVLGNTALNVDGLHPNAAGVDVIVARVTPQIIALGAAAGAVTEPLLLRNGSFEVWLTPDDVSGRHAIFSKDAAGQGTGGHVAALIDDGELVVALGSERADFVLGSGGALLQVGRSHHVVFTFGEAGMRLLVDGELVASDPSVTIGLDDGLGNFEPLILGAERGSSTFDGVIDEFAIYDRALPVEEVQALFEAGSAGNELMGSGGRDVLTGGADDEILRGRGANDALRGHGGNDVLEGNGGDDQLYAGEGDDQATGGIGDDRIYGGADTDTLWGDAGDDLIHGGPGDDRLNGSGGDDRAYGGGGDDLLFGGDGNDLLLGEGGRDVAMGEVGRDVLRGGDGRDQLFGNRGLDQLLGGAGDDLLVGGRGGDLLTGGPGRDILHVENLDQGIDRVTDFRAGAGGDALSLAAVLSFEDGDDANAFVALEVVDTGTRIAANADGQGDDFVTVFNLLNVAGLGVDQMVADGNLVLS